MAENDGSTTNTILGGLFALATPFAQTLAYGKENASELQLAQERAYYARLNGSGPNDPSAAVASAFSIREWLFGRPATATAPATEGNWPMLVLLGALGIVAYYFFRR